MNPRFLTCKICNRTVICMDEANEGEVFAGWGLPALSTDSFVAICPDCLARIITQDSVFLKGQRFELRDVASEKVDVNIATHALISAAAKNLPE